ncbi:hypothetical protein KO481_24785 [Nocardia sp. NEAU-G5]|uniref:Uncharacterized protein n=1 Tax=Nocardia albiluteola TaxID=2842303 RepID=A0ABS6B354_9NOCA|nr:hypothetical protein [Nocardia albiluteola]MBU3064731.1 hypothetical protein [Nocardia albiluteola]
MTALPETPLLHHISRSDDDVPAATDAEIAAIIAVARARGAHTLTLGSGRTPPAIATMAAVAAQWERGGGRIADHVTWPETAASWLRQARRFTATTPDLWVMTGPRLGWAQMTRRLLWSTPWSASNTIVTSEIADPAALALVGTAYLEGLTGVDAEGSVWTVTDSLLRYQPGTVR